MRPQLKTMKNKVTMQVLVITALLSITSGLGVVKHNGEKELRKLEAEIASKKESVLGVYYAEDLCITKKSDLSCTVYGNVGFWLEIAEEDGVKVINAEGAYPFESMRFEIVKEEGDTIYTKQGVEITRKNEGQKTNITFSGVDSITYLHGDFETFKLFN